ncbi:SDR family NAD(P)-dependent oxidoreductase [Acinetobacter shaoyimingii]|uniref:SDR family NAD(P)-dependent oxidoreductase n=1 Tax=Acinetobacter shaoyimingii TaxID=2715164 RepID=A0A6G8RW33_9GAMM|nr:SDR family NAD(P)-dependent oxidoreductase [Acinetobacter shaoyimingii]QIO06095.1 SDR family NAD(P)-dependent oxidoreductase [Acinetobacter shaoyimingii]
MKTIVITGANTGIGFATAKKCVQSGHHVILACRNLEKAKQAKQQLDTLAQQHQAKVEIVQLELNSLQNVNDTANDILSRFHKIDVLVNNAGLLTPQLESTQDGFEKQIGVNYLAHYLWTLKLLPLLKKSDAGRIIHLASLMHLAGSIQFDQFKADDVTRYNGVKRYGNSKLANLLMSNVLAEKLKDTPITSNAIHPGGVDSEIYRDLPKYQYAVIKLFLIPPAKPAQLIHDIAFDPAWANRSGEYISLQTPAFKSRNAKDIQLARKLYDVSYDYVKQYLE